MTTIDVPSAEFSTASSRAALTYPVPAHGSFFLPEPVPPRSPREEFFEEILDALTMGVGDYFEKNPVLPHIGVALSGGRDSLLTLLIAHRYASRVRPDDPGSLLRAFYMPSRHSSAETRRAAETICRELGVPLEIVPIDEAYERELAATEAMLGPGETVTELTRQNIQARIRGAADVELVQLLGRALPADRQHEREGGRLHHDRRRPGGRARRARQCAEDRRHGAARLPPGADRI